MIEITNISKSFNGTSVLENISGTFDRGITNLIIGASGTGKSVLLKCIVGLIIPETGEVLYDGRSFLKADKEEKAQMRREIGMLFQGGALFDSKNIEENVMFPLDLLTDMKKDEKLDRVNNVLSRVGLENINKKMPSEISGGQKKRVGIARAIVNDINYLFCDEPNSGLDPRTSLLIDELIQEITHELNVTTIVVTHDMNSVMGIGEHIIYLEKGKKLWEGNSDTVLTSNQEDLEEFIFASKFMKKLRKTL
ncbi:ABC transporter ATP-binding protein [Marivirga arenosa]|uniref:ATP-binding cassette domain-containing protein n=1 Tax=Marivirga arenosa TaxID=3059076 RepID=A0AA49JEA7_9BACT|nr:MULTISPECIES: ATP-binding cassette domain-containing protein [unclassified Marivirga]WKK87495.1 ATP-binding cassette domain-containing protein [Marivirga sp. ABR2-2]WNB18516.1 ATP-binding cassette domain-containing protein [Marivirga sp. BKB1-2]